MNFNDFITTELPLRPFVSTDGVAGQTLVRSNNPLAPREMVWADTGTGQSAYELAVSLGFQGSESAWLNSLVGASGADGKSAYALALDHGFVGSELQWLLSLKGADGGGTSVVYQTSMIGVSTSTTALIDSVDYTQYAQAVWDIVLQTASKIRRFTVASIFNRITNTIKYTSYGVIGDVIPNTVHVTYDAGSTQLRLSVQNIATEDFVVSALRYPIRI